MFKDPSCHVSKYSWQFRLTVKYVKLLHCKLGWDHSQACRKAATFSAEPHRHCTDVLSTSRCTYMVLYERLPATGMYMAVFRCKKNYMTRLFFVCITRFSHQETGILVTERVIFVNHNSITENNISGSVVAN